MDIMNVSADDIPKDRALRNAWMQRLDAQVAARYDAGGLLIPAPPLDMAAGPEPPETGPKGYGWNRQHAYDESVAACLAAGGYDSSNDLNRCAVVGNPDALARLRWITGPLDVWFAESDEPVESGPTFTPDPTPAPQEG